jgi:hypothetical protein
MTEHSLWRFSRALHRAINERQPADLAALLDEDVDWAIYGPIDMYPFFGSRRGKAAVIDVIRQISDNFRVHRFDRESIMLGVDSAASMMRYSLTALDRTSRSPCGSPISPSSGPAASPTSACWSIPSTPVEQTVAYPIHLPRMAVWLTPIDLNRHARQRHSSRPGIHLLRQPQAWMPGHPARRALCPAMTLA